MFWPFDSVNDKESLEELDALGDDDLFAPPENEGEANFDGSDLVTDDLFLPETTTAAINAITTRI